MRRIGLFGGSFDPVHDAHLALARAALRDLELDELRWIPAGQPWQKARVVTDAVHREAMVALAIEGEPRFVLDPIELRRPGPSYTLDTVRELQAAHPGAQWFLIVGQDQQSALPTWHRAEELLGRVTLAVARRPGAVDGVALASGARTIDLPPMDLSSTQVRARCAAGLSVDEMVPAGVARYIDQHGLYR
ncbi:MAG: nicotinate-nucleotide adenylyltransferase [Rhizobacter sp.]